MRGNHLSVLDDYNRLLEELKARNLWTVCTEFVCWLIVILISLGGNGFTLKIIFSNNNLKTSSNFLIASLAAADFGLNFFSVHLNLGVILCSRWPYNEAVCDYQGATALTFACASVLNITLMAVNRYVRVVQPRKYNKYFPLRRTVFYIGGVWLLSLLGSISYLVMGYTYILNPGKFFCYLHIDDRIFLAIVVTFYIALPSIIIVFCYYKVYRVIRKHNQSMKKWGRSSQNITSQEINVTKTLFLIVVMFMICWTPIFVMDIVDVVHMRWSLPRQAYVAYTFFAGGSCCINPVLYGIMNPTFRKEYLKILCWHRKCRKTVECEPSNAARGVANKTERRVAAIAPEVPLEIIE